MCARSKIWVVGAFSVFVKLLRESQALLSTSSISRGPGHVVHHVYLHCVIILVHIRYSSVLLHLWLHGIEREQYKGTYIQTDWYLHNQHKGSVFYLQ